MDILLTRSLNGRPITHEEMKFLSFSSKAFAEISKAVNERANRARGIAPNDNGKKSS